jgi:hypothetical protein
MKQSRRLRGGILDCFAEPVIGPRFARTRWLAMTVAPAMTAEPYGLIVMFAGGPGARSGSASRANSQSKDRVLRGSMISSTQNFSAERNGERSLFSLCSISFSFAALSSAASMSAR